MAKLFNWRETKWWYIGTVIAVLVGLLASVFIPVVHVSASADAVSIDVSVDISATLKPPEQPFRNQSQAITVTTLGTNQDKLGTSPWTALTGKSLTADDYVFVATAADAGDTAAHVILDEVVKDSYTTTNADDSLYGSYYLGQSFTTTSAYTIVGVKLSGYKQGTPVGNFIVSIYLADGSGYPTGSVLATGSIVATTIPGVTGTFVIPFSAPYSLSNSTSYTLVFSLPNGENTGNDVHIKSDTGAGYASGTAINSTNSGSTWNTGGWGDTTVDYVFYTLSVIGQDVSLAADATGNNATNVVCKIWSGKIAYTGTAYYIVITNTSTAKAMTALKASGLASSSAFDTSAQNTGSGTDATAGPTGTLAQNDELIIGCTGVEDEVDDAHGTFTTGASYVSGNEQFAATNDGGDTSNVQVHSVAEVVSATTAQNVADTGHDSNDWAACIATYKMAAAGTPAITVSPTSYDFGVVTASSTPYTTTSYFTIDNTSDVQTDQTISVTTSTWSGGSGWTHSDTATAGASTAGLLANKGGTWGTGDVIVKYSSPNFIAENQAATTDYSFGLKLIAPTSMGDGAQKTITVRVTAAAG